jgi:ATP-dependent DNA helicase DinG
LLSDALKDRIRAAYSATVAARGLTSRPGQRRMIATVANTLARIAPGDGAAGADGAGEPAVCVVEAGTGTGKTLAYALAAIPLAQDRGKRLVVATATVALQEQFVYRDLPDIAAGSGLSFSVALAKGRRRYVCLSKLDRQLAQGADAALPLYPDEKPAADALPVYESMVDALARGTWDGDRDGWPGAIDDATWLSVTTDHHQCTGRRCPNIGQCSFYRARESLQSADIVVANHDLVLADLALGGGAILPPPEETIYIFDEGHHLPDKALGHFSSFCRLHSTRQWLRDSARALGPAAVELDQVHGIEQALLELPATLEQLAAGLETAEDIAAALLAEETARLGREAERLRFPHGRVAEALMPIAASLAASFERAAGVLARLEARLEDALEENPDEQLEAWHLAMAGMRARAESTQALWVDFAADVTAEEPPRARWIQRAGNAAQPGYDLLCSPILAADILREHLWSRAAGVVVTSATLTALRRFDRFRQRSGVPEDAVFEVVGSPFDYRRATLTVPAMDADGGDAAAHSAELIARLPGWLDPDEAALVLFASRRQLLEVGDGVAAALGDRLLLQDSLGKQEILRRHREAVDAGRGSVIFGLASFAEGVDLPGAYCRHVVIAKLPFAVPDSPLEAALAEWIEARGGNAFMEISVPDAALRLVQASGRLLRSEADSGRITLCDRRVVSRRYGRAILDSLPPFRREIA